MRQETEMTEQGPAIRKENTGSRIWNMWPGKNTGMPPQCAKPSFFDWGNFSRKIIRMCSIDYPLINEKRELAWTGTENAAMLEEFFASVSTGSPASHAFHVLELLGRGGGSNMPPIVCKEQVRDSLMRQNVYKFGAEWFTSRCSEGTGCCGYWTTLYHT